ncbi:32161_t:CDS:2 [Gigaspora margarita]|uniref:32161_t:CDS:1 n=1 Tax=Gigaspora margarita TaxID=4874 RepID=A0ABN7VJ60_GIGMA|nr:32161_t:CDS:2 [Gigaspora margarita]
MAQNLDRIKSSVKKWFAISHLPIKVYHHCSEMSHNRRPCPYRRCNEHAIPEAQLNEILKGIKKFKDSSKYRMKMKLNTINNIERLREDIRAGRQQIRDTIRNQFRAQNDELNYLNQNIRNLNDNQNTIMNRQSETITRIETLRQRHMDRYKELATDMRNIRNNLINIDTNQETINNMNIARIREIHNILNQHHNNIINEIRTGNQQNTNLITQDDTNRIERIENFIRRNDQNFEKMFTRFREKLRNTINQQFDEKQRQFINSIIEMINNRRKNFRINQRREIHFKPQTTPPRTLNRIEEIPERINNMQNLVIHSRKGRELENAIIEPGSSSNIEFVTQSTTGKRIHKDSTEEEILRRKGGKISHSDQEFAIFKENILPTPKISRSNRASTNISQVQKTNNTIPINRRTDRDHLHQRQRREHR